MLNDTANWDGIELVSNNIGGKLRYRGFVYANEHERLLAKLLHHLRIPFTPHVRFLLEHADGKQRPYHPDFILDRAAYLWTLAPGKKPELIHGFEAKSRAAGHTEPEKKRLLLAQRGINVAIIDNDTIRRFHTERYLPLTSFPIIL